jgi:hypothetical protein
MATKAELYRYEAQRGGAKKPPQKRRTFKRQDTNDAGARNLSRRAEGKARVTIEESLSGRPSRKSSRPSEHKGKNSTVLEYAARMKSQRPDRRHAQR